MAFSNAFELSYTRHKMTNNKGFVAGSKIQKYYLGRVLTSFVRALVMAVNSKKSSKSKSIIT